jgi:hypothetical protein
MDLGWYEVSGQRCPRDLLRKRNGKFQNLFIRAKITAKGRTRVQGRALDASLATPSGHHSQRQFIPLPAGAAGLEIVAVHIHNRALASLLNVPLIGFALVLLDHCQDGPERQSALNLSFQTDLCSVMVTPFAYDKIGSSLASSCLNL